MQNGLPAVCGACSYAVFDVIAVAASVGGPAALARLPGAIPSSLHHSSSQAIDNARHAAEAKCIHLAQDSCLMRLQARPRASPRLALARRISVRDRK
jgi:hypothetical protein